MHITVEENMKFSLYYTLNSNLKKKDLTKEQKNELIDSLSILSKEEKEAFFMLLHEHAIVTDKNFTAKSIPYDGKDDEHGISFNLSKIPIPLRHILFKFVTMIKGRNQELDSQI